MILSSVISIEKILAISSIAQFSPPFSSPLARQSDIIFIVYRTRQTCPRPGFAFCESQPHIQNRQSSCWQFVWQIMLLFASCLHCHHYQPLACRSCPSEGTHCQRYWKECPLCWGLLAAATREELSEKRLVLVHLGTNVEFLSSLLPSAGSYSTTHSIC